MALWRRSPTPDAHLPKHDRGSGSLDDYDDDYDDDLVPNTTSTKRGYRVDLLMGLTR